ncbi:hypothetical protein LTSEINV_4724, partial [Salmonella enterica subsp. enterica serovar Inverness str. R8-3668]
MFNAFLITRAVTERGEQVESPRALFAIAKRSADPV